MSEQLVTLTDDAGICVEICVETFGDPAHPAVVLAAGAGASMLWWEAGVCERLAARQRYVVRYDQRDTGRSTTCAVGQPDYSQLDLAQDVLGVMDHLGLAQAHLVGSSMAGGLVLLLGVDHPGRFRTLTFVSTTPGDPDLPEGTVDWPAAPADLGERQVQVEHGLAVVRAFDAVSPHFDEDHARALVEADVDRSRDVVAALTNPFLIDFPGPRGGGFADVRLPTLVVHGELDPVFPLAHAEALAAHVPGARLLVLEGQGHDLLPHHWDAFVAALVEHTA